MKYQPCSSKYNDSGSEHKCCCCATAHQRSLETAITSIVTR